MSKEFQINYKQITSTVDALEVNLENLTLEMNTIQTAAAALHEQWVGNGKGSSKNASNALLFLMYDIMENLQTFNEKILHSGKEVKKTEQDICKVYDKE